VAGYFYPAGETSLRNTVKQLLARARSEAKFKRPGKIVALLAPHAGYQFSGLTAAHAYGLLETSEFSEVVVISPSHHEFFDAVSVCPAQCYETPLGKIAISEPLRRAFLASGGPSLIEDWAGHGEEHALEVHLPFLQEALGKFELLPLVMGNQSAELSEKLGETLGRILKNKKVLVVASSDLSHFYDYEKANLLDHHVLEAVSRFDTAALKARLNTTKFEACGAGPLLAAMLAARHLGAKRVEILHHCNSGDITHDRSRVVGYMSAVIY
jgi:AmmeMemoRadiSam system protein B